MLYAIAAGILYIILPNVEDAVIKFALPIYAGLLLTMCWRAVARADKSPISSVTALGSVLFVISDFIICFHVFYSSISVYQVSVMATYYAAQLAITLSAAEIFVRQEGGKSK